jgi:hypothetical protein
MVGAIPSRLKRSRAQNRTRSNFLLLASSNSWAKALRFSAAFRPLSCSTYSYTTSCRALAHHTTLEALSAGSRGPGPDHPCSHERRSPRAFHPRYVTKGSLNPVQRVPETTLFAGV